MNHPPTLFAKSRTALQWAVGLHAFRVQAPTHPLPPPRIYASFAPGVFEAYRESAQNNNKGARFINQRVNLAARTTHGGKLCNKFFDPCSPNTLSLDERGAVWM